MATEQGREAVAAGVGRPRRTRAVASVICVVLSALLTAPAMAAHWAYATLVDTQRYVATVGPLATFPEVQDVIAKIAIDALEKRVDVQQVLDDALGAVAPNRARLRPLVPLMTAAVDGAIEREVRDFVASEAFKGLWVTMNTRTQQAFVRVLRGDPTSVLSLRGDALVLDVADVVDVVRRRLVDRGLTVLARVPVPTVDTQVVLFRGPQLARARTVYAVAAPVAPWALWVAGLLSVAAIVLAARRSWMLSVVGVAMAVNGLLIASALVVGRQSATDQLSGTALAPAVPVAFSALVEDLERGWKVLFWLGIFLAVAGWVAGTSAAGTAARLKISTALRRAFVPGENRQVPPS